MSRREQLVLALFCVWMVSAQSLMLWKVIQRPACGSLFEVALRGGIFR